MSLLLHNQDSGEEQEGMSSAVASTSAHKLTSEALTATHNVHYALSPRIGVISSPDVLSALEANHLTDFADLLKPFEDSIENRECRIWGVLELLC